MATNANKPKYLEVELGGTPIATAFPPAVLAGDLGMRLFDRTAGVAYTLRNLTGAQDTSGWQWQVDGGASSSLPKYFVSNTTPPGAYSTITAAIAAAVADGHNDADPAVILVYPGIYAESFTLPAGISLSGVEGKFGLAGNISISATSFVCNIQNLLIQGNITFSTGTTQLYAVTGIGRLIVTAGSAANTAQYFFNCEWTNSTAGAVLSVTNNNPASASGMTAYSSTFANTDSSVIDTSSSDNYSVDLTNCILTAKDNSGNVLVTRTGAGNRYRLKSCKFNGTMSIANNSTVGTFYCQFTPSAGVPAATLGGAGANIDAFYPIYGIDNSASALFAGTGTYSPGGFEAFSVAAPQIQPAAGITVSGGYPTRSANQITGTAVDFDFGTDANAFYNAVAVDTTGALRTVTMAPTQWHRDGYTVYIGRSKGANNINVIGAGADTVIDGAGIVRGIFIKNGTTWQRVA